MKKSISIKRNVYAMASQDGQSAEITMYGDIYENLPRDWWTGEPIKGQFITLETFLEDLKQIQECTSITIRMNSYGGDAGASNTIHNRLRELARSGVETRCIVDGAAMSGGSLIMSACDTVIANPSSLIMIHLCWNFFWGGYNANELRKAADENDAWDKMQVECYKRKTGMSDEEILGMMAETTYMTGREAMEKGFVDELLEDAEPTNIAASANGNCLFVNGRKMHLAPGMTLPRSLLTDNTYPKENRDMVNERTRLQEIDAIASAFTDEDVQEAKYGSVPCTAQELAHRVAKNAAEHHPPPKADVPMTEEEKLEAGRQLVKQLLHHDDSTHIPSATNDIPSSDPQTKEEKIEAGRASVRALLGK